jgi:hypothetical protein
VKLTAVTATWQRPEAMALCRKYVERQSRQPDQWLILDGPGRMGDKLLTAFASGAVEGDALVFVEDDDYYFPGWFRWCERHLERGYDIVGQGNALYYNVRHRWWSNCANTRHASLCQTAISCRLLEPACACNIIKAYDNQFFDTRIWRLNVNKYLHLAQDGERMAIGIKGMPGTAGYSAEHKQELPPLAHADPSLLKLWQLIGAEAKNYAAFKA